MSEQERIATELDQRVAERTRELAEANDALKRELAAREQAEARQSESERNLRQLTETIPVMLWSATPEGAIDYCNARFLEYTGFDAEQVMGRGGFTKVLFHHRKHGGRLWGEPNDGPGATFAFSIPRDPERRTDAALVMRNS